MQARRHCRKGFHIVIPTRTVIGSVLYQTFLCSRCLFRLDCRSSNRLWVLITLTFRILRYQNTSFLKLLGVW